MGLRLDHDRRAWVEATAAEQGVSVRAVFEALIDRARAAEIGEADPFAPPGLDGDSPVIIRAGADGPQRADIGPWAADSDAPAVDSPGETSPYARRPPGAAGSVIAAPAHCMRLVVAFSGHTVGVAGSLVRRLAETNGNHVRTWARDNWRILTQPPQQKLSQPPR